MSNTEKVEVDILRVKEAQETVSLGEKRDVTIVTFLPKGYPIQRVTFPTKDYTPEALQEAIIQRISELKKGKPLKMFVDVPIITEEEEEE